MDNRVVPAAPRGVGSPAGLGVRQVAENLAVGLVVVPVPVVVSAAGNPAVAQVPMAHLAAVRLLAENPAVVPAVCLAVGGSLAAVPVARPAAGFAAAGSLAVPVVRPAGGSLAAAGSLVVSVVHRAGGRLLAGNPAVGLAAAPVLGLVAVPWAGDSPLGSGVRRPVPGPDSAGTHLGAGSFCPPCWGAHCWQRSEFARPAKVRPR